MGWLRGRGRGEGLQAVLAYAIKGGRRKGRFHTCCLRWHHQWFGTWGLTRRSRQRCFRDPKQTRAFWHQGVGLGALPGHCADHPELQGRGACPSRVLGGAAARVQGA